MKTLKSRIATLVLATLGGSAIAGVIVPIASPDGGYAATGAAEASAWQPTGSTSRMGAGPAMPSAVMARDVFMSADGTPMALGGAQRAAAAGSWSAAEGAMGPGASTVVTRGNAE